MNVRTLVNTAYAAIVEGMDEAERTGFDATLARVGDGVAAPAPKHPMLRSVPNQQSAMMAQMSRLS